MSSIVRNFLLVPNAPGAFTVPSMLVVLALCPPLAGYSDDRPLLFESDVLPVLTAKCGKCHSATVQKGGLDLSTMPGVRRGGESGDAAIAESVEESLLWTMIEGGEMPPEDEPQLTQQDREVIRRWIAEGAMSEMPVDDVAIRITQHDVLPIVLLRCATCHGRQRQDGGLDLRTVAKMRAGGNSGPAIVPGDPDGSLMIKRIASEACPPRESLLKFFVRRAPSSEVATLRQWIAEGAEEVERSLDLDPSQGDPLVSDEDRQHWAFQPPNANFELDAIDQFILRKLSDNNLNLSPQADRDILIRRAYLDLIGMPPSFEQWRKWHHHPDPGWYSSMIDELLESPHYGERWGRYWLDVAGYADSEGGVSADPIRQVSWKYRDYVIRAFNEDKPYDRFLLEQLAGDELVDYQNAKFVDQQTVDCLTATGFLRQGIDETGSRTMNFVPERLGVISDAIKVLGSGVMGLTMECARCHSHKYDAIPQRDYYRFKAILQGAFDEHDWLTFKNRHLDVATETHRQRVAETNPPLTKKIKQLERNLKQAIADRQIETLRHHYPDQPDADRDATLKALNIADNNRTQTQRILVEMLQQAENIAPSQQPASVLAARSGVQKIEREIELTRRRMEPPSMIRALWDRGQPSPTYVLRRGEHDKPGQPVGPGVPSVLSAAPVPLRIDAPAAGKTGRRLALAKWLTQQNHPLTARVMVNRIWYHHFGAGLVESLENFGVQGDRPSHPELLDWLAVEFAKRSWSIKSMHRLIMNSQTYRQSSAVTADRLQRDPQNRLLSRMPMRRMDAEALRDSLLSVSGRLDETIGGPPDPVAVNHDGLVSAVATPDGRWRRSVYLRYRRTEIPSLMETFDYPEMGPNCVSRNISIVSPQSLMLMNNQRVRQLSETFAERVAAKADSDDRGQQVDLVYQIALSRSPDPRQRGLGIETLNKLDDAWNHRPGAALATYCHTILNSAAFLYID